MEREKLKSRLGFILLSAGCAIGIGNVWKFPYMAGQGGGGAFVLFYLLFLVILGLPIMTMEFAVGRASHKSPVRAYQALEKPGQKWHIHGYFTLIGCYLLMMFYTTVAGWMLHYFYMTAAGKLVGLDTDQVAGKFTDMLASPLTMGFWMVVVVAIGIFVCARGLQNGLEKVTKVMMIALLVIMVVLAVNSMFMPGAKEGLTFFLVPDFERMKEVGVVNTLVGAMNQAFFTLSLGIGAMAIFGSYIGKEHALLGESVRVVVLDTFVAITAGLIIFPACFTYGVDQTSGPSLIFITLPNIFANMAMGRLWGSLFFLFMAFAALSTVLAVFENIICCGMELTGWNRQKSSLVNFFLIIALSLPCVLGYNVWAWDGFAIFGGAVLDVEDFLVSNLFLPLGSLVYLLFCVTRWGWGWDNYKKEVNTGKGLKMLEEAGVKVECGLEAEEAEEINRGFLKRQREGMPWVRTKMAMSVDGNTALANGKSQWITSEEARADGHFWRGISGAVLTGLGTVLADNPQMTARFEGVTRQPLKVVVDSNLSLNPDLKIFQGGKTLLVCAHYDIVRAENFESQGVEVIELPGKDGKVDLRALMKELAKREINDVHVEAGARLNGALAMEGLIDEYLIYVAPVFLGDGRRLLDLPSFKDLCEGVALEFTDIQKVGPDVRLMLRPVR